jgi:hypothetical protein
MNSSELGSDESRWRAGDKILLYWTKVQYTELLPFSNKSYRGVPSEIPIRSTKSETNSNRSNTEAKSKNLLRNLFGAFGSFEFLIWFDIRIADLVV